MNTASKKVPNLRESARVSNRENGFAVVFKRIRAGPPNSVRAGTFWRELGPVSLGKGPFLCSLFNIVRSEHRARPRHYVALYDGRLHSSTIQLVAVLLPIPIVLYPLIFRGSNQLAKRSLLLTLANSERDLSVFTASNPLNPSIPAMTRIQVLVVV